MRPDQNAEVGKGKCWVLSKSPNLDTAQVSRPNANWKAEAVKLD